MVDIVKLWVILRILTRFKRLLLFMVKDGRLKNVMNRTTHANKNTNRVSRMKRQQCL